MNLLKLITFLWIAPIIILVAQTKGVSPNVQGDSINGKTFFHNTYAVVVGISDYQDPDIPDLKYADKDAIAFAQYLQSDAGGNLDADHLKLLINDQATMAQFANALDWLWEECKVEDHVIIYFSGHGDVEKKSLSQPGFLLCWDSPSRVYMAGGAFSLSMLQEVVSTLSVQNKSKVVVITDACHSGKLAGSSVGGSQATAINLSKQFANEIKIMSCQANEFSIEGTQWGGGRGAFSYHLIDALYGMADQNRDMSVTLQEVGRYLEDHVSKEVAPISQIPMVIGDRTEKLANVNVKALSTIESGKLAQSKTITSIESRGFEEEVLSKVDSNIKKLFILFKQALADKRLIEPVGSCANIYFEQLIRIPEIKSIHSAMRRNFAAALQDDAQQLMNSWLRANVAEMECMRKKYRDQNTSISKQLDLAAKLLGEDHYMYKSLVARKLLFEGKNLNSFSGNKTDPSIGRKCLQLYNNSLEYEPNSPNTYHLMSMAYINNLKNPDSAYLCAQLAHQLAPNWVLPFTELANVLIHNYSNQMELARSLINQAMEIDSTHGYVWQQMGKWFIKKKNFDSAFYCFKKYETLNKPEYPCWYNELGQYYLKTKNYEEAEKNYLKAIDLDSTRSGILLNLGVVYYNTKKYDLCEKYYMKAISYDSMSSMNWNNLGNLYKKTNRDVEAEQAYLKSIKLDTLDSFNWCNLGNFYLKMKKFPEAFNAYLKSLRIDSSSQVCWSNLGDYYYQTSQHEKALKAFYKSISLDSMYKLAWFNTGVVSFELKLFKEAEVALNKVVSLDSTHAMARYYLGKLYSAMNLIDSARQNLQMAIKLNPEYGSNYVELAILAIQSNDPKTGLLNLEEALKRNAEVKSIEKNELLKPLLSTEDWEKLKLKFQRR